MSEAERKEAPRLYRMLKRVRDRMLAGEMDVGSIEQDGQRDLASAGWTVDYVALRRQRDLHKPTPQEIAAGEPLVIISAAKLGTTRLIDNLEV